MNKGLICWISADGKIKLEIHALTPLELIGLTNSIQMQAIQALVKQDRMIIKPGEDKSNDNQAQN